MSDWLSVGSCSPDSWRYARMIKFAQENDVFLGQSPFRHESDETHIEFYLDPDDYVRHGREFLSIIAGDPWMR